MRILIDMNLTPLGQPSKRFGLRNDTLVVNRSGNGQGSRNL
jgi:hypothetical protein